MHQWPVREELIVIGVILVFTAFLLVLGFLFDSMAMKIVAISVGPAVGWVLGMMTMEAWDHHHPHDPS